MQLACRDHFRGSFCNTCFGLGVILLDSTTDMYQWKVLADTQAQLQLFQKHKDYNQSILSVQSERNSVVLQMSLSCIFFINHMTIRVSPYMCPHMSTINTTVDLFACQCLRLSGTGRTIKTVSRCTLFIAWLLLKSTH